MYFKFLILGPFTYLALSNCKMFHLPHDFLKEYIMCKMIVFLILVSMFSLSPYRSYFAIRIESEDIFLL